jgi:hypothetical protein
MNTQTASDNLAPSAVTAQPHFHQAAPEIQSYGTVTLRPIELDEPIRLEMTAQLNVLLADTMNLRASSHRSKVVSSRWGRELSLGITDRIAHQHRHRTCEPGCTELLRRTTQLRCGPRRFSPTGPTYGEAQGPVCPHLGFSHRGKGSRSYSQINLELTNLRAYRWAQLRRQWTRATHRRGRKQALPTRFPRCDYEFNSLSFLPTAPGPKLI